MSMSVFWLHTLSDSLSAIDSERVTRMQKINTLTAETTKLAEALADVRSNFALSVDKVELDKANKQWGEAYEELQNLKSEEKEFQKSMQEIMGKVMDAAVVVKGLADGDEQGEDGS